jgi:hypothetical protein
MTTSPGTPTTSRIARLVALSAATCATLAGMTVSASADAQHPSADQQQQADACVEALGGSVSAALPPYFPKLDFKSSIVLQAPADGSTLVKLQILDCTVDAAHPAPGG